MKYKLFQKNFLRLMDLNSFELNQLLFLSKKLKQNKINKKEKQKLIGKNIVLVFEKDSSRTRCAFEIAAYDQGANITYLGLSGNQIGHKESINDTARVLGRMYDGIQYRGYEQKNVEALAKFSGVPVWNGLTNQFHPTQILADLFTMQECLPKKSFNEMKLAYIGDAHNNIGNSLLEAAALTGITLFLIAPNAYWPNSELVKNCRCLAKENGGDIFLTEKIQIGVKNADFIYTDVWVSMGENIKIWKERISILRKYQVNMDILSQTENSEVKFMHCLPAFHDNNTSFGKHIGKEHNFPNGIEVTNEVFESSFSIVFNQAENRLHTIKALIISTLT